MTDYVSALSVDPSLIYPEIALLLGSFVLLAVACIKRLNDSAPIFTLLIYLIVLGLVVRQWIARVPDLQTWCCATISASYSS